MTIGNHITATRNPAVYPTADQSHTTSRVEGEKYPVGSQSLALRPDAVSRIDDWLRPSIDDLMERLPCDELRHDLVTKLELLKEPPAVLSPAVEAKALSIIESSPSRPLSEITYRFMNNKVARSERCPVFDYDRSVTVCPVEQIKLNIDPSKHAARSLLQTGLLPSRPVYASTLSAGQDLIKDDRNPHLALVTTLGVTATMAAISASPSFISAAIGVLCVHELIMLNRDRVHAKELIAGYTLESLDAFKRIKHGSILEVGATLDELFSNPSHPENHGNWTRADGFVIARVLRLLGDSPQTIYDRFKEGTGVVLRGSMQLAAFCRKLELAIDRLPSRPHKVFAPKGPLAEKYKDLRGALETIQQIYFRSAIAQREVTRLDYAKAILAPQE